MNFLVSFLADLFLGVLNRWFKSREEKTNAQSLADTPITRVELEDDLKNGKL